MMSKWGVGIDNFLLFGQASSLWCWGRHKSSVSMYVDVFVRYHDYRQIDHILN